MAKKTVYDVRCTKVFRKLHPKVFRTPNIDTKHGTPLAPKY
jgi:hypothetical protein